MATKIQFKAGFKDPARVLTVSVKGDVANDRFYSHPNVTPDQSHEKGRLLRASKSIPQGTLLLAEEAYAIVPAQSPTGGSKSICSNHGCSRRVAKSTHTIRCDKGCDEAVVWCDRSCQDSDTQRHKIECAWLRQFGPTMRCNETEYDFITLWHVVRLLCRHHVEGLGAPSVVPTDVDGGFLDGWTSVLACCDYLESWPCSQVQHWTRLSKTYMHELQTKELMTSDDMLALICKEETNTFGLYTKATGASTGDGPRGEPFAFGLYPNAARFNHSCQPNVSHKPDSHGRMTFTAARDIAEGEECTISYFDLAVHKNVEQRQLLVREQFRFRCTCMRCAKDERDGNLVGIESMPFGLLD